VTLLYISVPGGSERQKGACRIHEMVVNLSSPWAASPWCILCYQSCQLYSFVPVSRPYPSSHYRTLQHLPAARKALHGTDPRPSLKAEIQNASVMLDSVQQRPSRTTAN